MIIQILPHNFSRNVSQCTSVNVTSDNKEQVLDSLDAKKYRKVNLHFSYIGVTKYYTELDCNCHNNDESK